MLTTRKSKNGKLNVNSVVRHSLCTGCGTCIGVCPSDAITVKEKSGIYLPEIDKSRCNMCGICYKSCPGHTIKINEISKGLFPNPEQEDFYMGRFIESYTGFSTDFNIRNRSASGGVVTQLIIFMLENKIIDGALVTRMQKNNPLAPEVIIATTKEEVFEARSSKYCPVPASIAIKEIRKRQGRFAVVGLPCHIHGFRKVEDSFPDIKKKIFLYLGIYCSSSRTFGATKYLLRSFGISEKEVECLSYRDEGCLGNMVVKLNNNEVRRYPYKDYYPKTRSFFIPYRCTLCVDHFAELADISFGDIHIPEFWDDKVGTTSIIVRSERGKDVLFSAVDQGYIEPNKVDKELVVKSQKGSLLRKKEQITNRFALLRFFGRKLPEYDLVALPVCLKDKLKYLTSSIILYVEIWVGKRRFLWPVIKYLNIIAEKLNKFREIP